ncbi:UDP-N-acetylglucosamine 1-carboxyvinyltransferase [Candidatus Parcubacteria bacterium]|nr:UDP-N-acetylglucosamine 1-carboxyvinyltransferase [Candidatus Parcubacteria bacterium]
MPDIFRITGGRPLEGSMTLSGAKNAASKMMIASLLTEEPVILKNVPRQQETQITQEILEAAGARVEWEGENTLLCEARTVGAGNAGTLSRKNRISILSLAPLLHRAGEAVVPLVGGDAIGPRPVNFHLEILRKMGAQIDEASDHYRAVAKKRLKGTLIELSYPSVGATETAILAGVLADGRTVIRNAASEPEVEELVMMLQTMGAIIQLNAGRVIEIIGVERLHGTCVRVMPDRIEAASYACMALGTRGEILVRGAQHEHLITFLNTVRKIGGEYDVRADGILFKGARAYKGIELETDTHPGFMTDWQQPFVVLLTQAKGTSVVHETVYEERFGYTAALNQMGASVTLFSNCLGEVNCRFKGQNYRHSAVITGPTSLHATDVTVPDIRAGLAFVVAAMVAEGTSNLSGIEHLDRGYEQLEEKLKSVGATIERVCS